MGQVIGVGLGPGDPELMSVRAARALAGARHVAFFRKAGRPGRARATVEGLIPASAREWPMEYPVTTEIDFNSEEYLSVLEGFYRQWADLLAALAGESDVHVLCEGDPFFYGSFMHLHSRLHDRVAVSVIPGITGMSAAWAASGVPITWGDDVLTVIPATLSEADIARHAQAADALVVMKIGRNLGKLRRALAAAGRLDRAVLIHCASMAEERLEPLADAGDGPCPYFAIALVHGEGRRP